MKKGKEEAERWLKQSEYCLKVAEGNLRLEFFAASCFMSEQAAQMALKAYLIFKTGRSVFEIHSIHKLAEQCQKFDKKFKQFIGYGRILDRYYIPTRYPDALTPPAVPYETYTLKDASEVLKYSTQIVEMVTKDFKVKSY